MMEGKKVSKVSNEPKNEGKGKNESLDFNAKFQNACTALLSAKEVPMIEGYLKHLNTVLVYGSTVKLTAFASFNGFEINQLTQQLSGIEDMHKRLGVLMNALENKGLEERYLNIFKS